MKSTIEEIFIKYQNFRKKSIYLVSMYNGYGNTPLFEATNFMEKDKIYQLLQEGCDPSFPTIYGVTPWMFINDFKEQIPDQEIIEWFKQYGALKPYHFIKDTPVKNYGGKFFMMETRDKDIKEILNISNKRLYKAVCDNLLKEGVINTSYFNMIYILKTLYPDIDEQLLVPLSSNIKNIYLNPHELISCKELFQNISPKKTIQLFNTVEDLRLDPQFFYQIILMFQNLKKKNINININKDIKCFFDLHLYLCGLENKSSRQERSFKYDKSFDLIDLYLPKTNYELIDIGQEMKNCVGNLCYSYNIEEKESFLAFLKKERFVACVEFDYHNILKISGITNKKVNKDIKKEIESKISKFHLMHNTSLK